MRIVLLACALEPADTANPADLRVAADPTIAYRDADGDGFGDATDCDGTDATIFPGAPEVSADGVDQDCDGADACTGPRRWHPGDVHLRSAAEWEALCAVYDAVDGSLYLEADAPPGLEGCLCEVSGSATQSYDETGHGMRGLTAVGGRVKVGSNHDLRSLRWAGALTVDADAILLRRLVFVQGDVRLEGGKESAHASLPLLHTVGGRLTVYGTNAGLPALIRADSAHLQDAQATMVQAQEIGLLILTHGDVDAPALETLGTLSWFTGVLNPPRLQSMDKINAHTSAGSVITAVTHIGLISGSGGMPFMPVGVDLAHIRIDHAVLTGTLPDPSVIGGHLIVDHYEGTSLAALSTVEHLPASLRILNSETLTTLGLDGLETIGAGLLISRNGALPDSEIDALLDQVTVAGAVVVE
jgi:hypothetical protein